MGASLSSDPIKVKYGDMRRWNLKQYIDEDYLQRFFEAAEAKHEHRWILSDGDCLALLNPPYSQTILELSVSEAFEYYRRFAKKTYTYEVYKDGPSFVVYIFYTDYARKHLTFEAVKERRRKESWPVTRLLRGVFRD